MKTLKLDFFSLKNRIGLGFTFICGLLIIVGLISYMGLQKSESYFSLFSDQSSQVSFHVEIERNVSEIQRQAERFTYEGSETAENKVYSLFESIKKDLNSAHKSVSDEEINIILNKMIEHLNIYINTFKEVAVERKLRNNLVQEKLRNDAEKSEMQLSEYAEFHKKMGASAHANEASLLLNEILKIQKNAHQYFDVLDSTLVVKIKHSFSNLLAGVKKLKKEEEHLKAMEFLNKSETTISNYEKELLRAVQATRGYLYLVNVVMAGETAELLYKANKLKKISVNNMSSIRQQIVQLFEGTIFLTTTMTIITVILSIILSWIVGKSITAPIAQITNAFKLLAKGDHRSQIPGRDFKDEIGDLSRAADIFKKKNRETEVLLKKTQSLASELESNKRELAKSNDELEQFVYTVSHDLKSPLVTSMGFISMINDLAGRGESEKAIKKLNKVVEANKRMGQLINDLLELSRVGRTELDKKDLDMNMILKNFRESIRHKLKNENFDLVFETEFPVIYANESRILQVFENMMSNAFKYAVNQSGNVVYIGSKEDKNEYLFYIKDHGQGISKEYHEKIFGLFYRLDNSMPGTGIGLSVVRKVMQFHEGRVYVKSDVGKGSTFWLAFPKKTNNL